MTAVMQQDISEAVSAVEEAAGILFDAEPSVRSVGVGRYRGRPSFVAVRNSAAIVPLSGRLGVDSAPSKLLGFAVHYLDSFNDPVSELRLPHTGPGSPGTVSLVPELCFIGRSCVGCRCKTTMTTCAAGPSSRGTS